MASDIEYHDYSLTLIPINIQVYNTLRNQLGLRNIIKNNHKITNGIFYILRIS